MPRYTTQLSGWQKGRSQMGKKVTLKCYEYPLKDGNGKTYYGSYTILEGVEPVGFKGEKLIQTFDCVFLQKGERLG